VVDGSGYPTQPGPFDERKRGTRPNVSPDEIPGAPVAPHHPGAAGAAGVDVAHYRDKSLNGPRCGALRGPGVKVVRTLGNATCPACIAASPSRGRPPKKTAPPASEPEPEPQHEPSPEQRARGVEAMASMVALGCYMGRRPPPDPGLALAWGESVMATAEHYGLAGATAHPAVQLAISSAVLGLSIAATAPIADDTALKMAHGLPVEPPEAYDGPPPPPPEPEPEAS
jgi:hypothetical protein